MLFYSFGIRFIDLINIKHTHTDRQTTESKEIVAKSFGSGGWDEADSICLSIHEQNDGRLWLFLKFIFKLGRQPTTVEKIIITKHAVFYPISILFKNARPKEKRSIATCAVYGMHDSWNLPNQNYMIFFHFFFHIGKPHHSAYTMLNSWDVQCTQRITSIATTMAHSFIVVAIIIIAKSSAWCAVCVCDMLTWDGHGQARLEFCFR